MSTHVFGIRHHGPGCARSLLAALEALNPDVILVEGPPDAHAVLPLMLDEHMRPPVALLVYAPEDPSRAVFYPFTHFSPEWQALRFALERKIPARFMDLPQAIALAVEPEAALSAALPEAPVADAPAGSSTAPPDVPVGVEPTLQDDPIGLLAQAAGYTDHELWWEHQIEQRQDATDLFAGIMEAMATLRGTQPPANDHEARREAHMRQTIRAAQDEGFQRIAVVCGAWHAPAIVNPGPARPDVALLSGLRRIKVEATWTPWTNARLAFRSGYGAGVAAPGWYAHLWTAPDRSTIRWVTHAARLLRTEDLDAPASNVIEAVRLGEALAALRDLPMPGLAELHEAMQTTLCGGDPAPMTLIRDRLEIGEALGEVPEETPAVPLQRDLTAQQRRLRLKPTTEIKSLDLDLRNDTDRARSHLLHRLQILGIPWGRWLRAQSKTSTFHELWTLQWHVNFAVSLIEANIWGNTVEDAATARLRDAAKHALDLPGLTQMLDSAILAELPEAVDHLLDRVRDQAAVAADVRHLMDALPPLAHVARYGNIRQTRAEQIMPVIDALFERAVVGLPAACASLDDDAAQAMVASIGRAQETVDLLQRDDQRGEWQAVLRHIATSEGIHGLVRGWCCRLLLDQRVLDSAELQRLARLALSPATPALQAAAWVEGVLRGSGLILLQQDGLWLALDGWLADLAPETFTAMLPLVRRAFSGFQRPERRSMGEKVKHLRSGDRTGARPGGMDGLENINHERARLVLPVLAQILGVQVDGNR